MNFVLRVIINAVAIWLAATLVPGVDIKGGDTLLGKILIVALIALVFVVVNMIVKPIVKLIALPIYILTLGLFTLVVNAVMLMLTAWITEQAPVGLRVGGFVAAVIGALIISIASLILGAVTGANRKR
ncbi:phage holin family protein [Pengzhenrongella sp.]|jgi:putative membrane protein|uniref:phage holin family protein n=1 Tax=Pengzhenrongella sp. TaxID=2888820 RepID=UPI002F93035A